MIRRWILWRQEMRRREVEALEQIALYLQWAYENGWAQR